MREKEDQLIGRVIDNIRHTRHTSNQSNSKSTSSRAASSTGENKASTVVSRVAVPERRWYASETAPVIMEEDIDPEMGRKVNVSGAGLQVQPALGEKKVIIVIAHRMGEEGIDYSQVECLKDYPKVWRRD